MPRSFRRPLLAMLLALPWLAQAVPVDFPAGERLAVVSKRASTGTHLARAIVDDRTLKGGGLRKVVEAALAQPLQACTGDGSAGWRVVVKPQVMPDRIGFTNQRLEGAGLYVSLPESGYDGRGNWYLAPFASQVVELQRADGSPLASVDLKEFTRHEFDRDLLGKMDFLQVDERTLVDAVEPFLKAQYAKAGTELARQACRKS